MKTSEVLTRLWSSTCYSVLAHPGRDEAKTVMQMLQKTLEILAVFHHSLEAHLAKTKALTLNIPVMDQFREEMLRCRTTFTGFLQQEARKIGSLVHRQAEYMFILDSSEEEAKEEFTLHTYNSLARARVPFRRLKSILDQSRAATPEQNARACVSAKSDFERWCANYSVRTHQFFLHIYSTNWWQNSTAFSSKIRLPIERAGFGCYGAETASVGQNSLNQNRGGHEEGRGQGGKQQVHSCTDVFIEQPPCKEEPQQRDLIQEIFNEIEQANIGA